MQNAREDQHDADLLRAQVGAFGATPPLSPENPSAEQTDDLPPYPDLDPDMTVAKIARHVSEKHIKRLKSDQFAIKDTAHQLDDGSSEDDHEPPQEGEDRNEELILLDPEHPLNKRFQEAKRTYLRKRLEGLQQELRKKRAVKKEEDRKLQDTGTKLFGIQEELGRAENKLRDSQQSTANAEVQRQHAHDQLEKTKSKYSNMSSQSSHAKTKVSRLQAELEKKLQQVTFTQAVNEELHSKVKIMDNARHKLGTKKTQAEEEKIKQDLYVERLTKDLESKTLQVAEYEVQRSAQAQETQEVSEGLCEAEMELESLLIMHKKLLQQWNSNITDIRRQDETVNAMLEAVRAVEDEMILLDREIEGYKKCVDAEQKNNETLTFQLSRSQMDCVTWEKLISQKQMDGMALQAQYSACLHSLSETKQIFGTLTKEMGTHQTELNSQRNQVEKLSAARLELEEKIMAHIQQQLTHSKAATYSQHLISKMASQKKEKMNQLQQLERDVLSVKLESQRVEQQVNSLTLTVETLDEKINKYNKLLTSHENTFSLTVREIKQKETTINYLKNRISKIVESTGHEDLGPLQIRIQKILTEIEELAAHIKNEQHLWMLFQGTLVALTRELETNNKKMRKLQKDYTGLQQKEIRLENLTKQEERDQAEMEKNLKLLRRDLEKLCKLKKKNTECSETLELESTQMETDFKNKLKEAEQESASIQMKLEKTQEEKENLLKCLLEAEQQIMLWEKKTQILKETRSVVDSEMNQGEIRKMKAEIHRMELQVSKLTKQQEQLMRESEKAVSRRENLDMRKDTMIRDRHKEYTKEELKRTTDFLQRKVQKTVREVADCEQTVKELESNKSILSEKIWGQKQHLTGLSCIKTKLEDDFMKLQEDKNMNQIYLFAMQSRNKKLQEVCAGGYKISSGSETLEVTLLSQRQRLEDYSDILRRSCGDFPRHQAALRRITRAAEAYLKVFNQ